MDVSAEFRVDADVRKAMQAFTNEEAAKLLTEAGKKLIQREELFQKHFELGQSKWKPATPKYERWKKRKYGSTEKFVKTGAAKRSLKTPGEYMQMRASGTKRKLSIFLRRKQDGVNVYALAQKGRFSGLRFGDDSFISVKDVHAGKAKGKKGATRVSSNSREVTTVQSGDESVAESVIREEFAITMGKRNGSA